MKKFLGLALILVLSFALAACGTNSKDTLKNKMQVQQKKKQQH